MKNNAAKRVRPVEDMLTEIDGLIETTVSITCPTCGAVVGQYSADENIGGVMVDIAYVLADHARETGCVAGEEFV